MNKRIIQALLIFVCSFYLNSEMKAQVCDHDSLFFVSKNIDLVLKEYNLSKMNITKFRILKDEKQLQINGVVLLIENNQNAIFLKIKAIPLSRELIDQIGDCDNLESLPRKILKRRIIGQYYCDRPWYD